MLDKMLFFGQYIIAFVIVNLFLPRLIFSRKNDTALSNFFAYFIQMVLLVIIIGYLLVLLKIFEMVTILGVFLLIILGRTFILKSKKKRKEISKEISFWLYDYTDGIINLPQLIKKRFSEWRAGIKARFAAMSSTAVIVMIAAVALLVYSGYLRLYDSFINSAPAMSDSYVTLAWIKYIGQNFLFHDGIYPQGFHIYQAVLHKFSGLDVLFVLRFTGPINAVLIVLGIYFTVSGFLKNKPAGIMAAAVYGLFSLFLTGSIERQAATNSQEFAFVFILPCLYFLYRYLTEKKMQDLYVAGSALTVIGLVHTLVLVFTVFAAVMVLFAFLLSDRSKPKAPQVKKLFLAGILSGVISLIPFGIGFLFGHELHGSSVEFATRQDTAVGYPTLVPSDYVVVVCLFLLFVSIVFNRKKPFVSTRMFLFLFGGATFCLYYFGGALTNSVLISSRANEFYSLVAPVVIGGGVYAVIRIFDRFKYSAMVFTLLFSVMITGACIWVDPQPIIPYKMEYNSDVDQYLRISRNYRKTEWLIVSQEEGYDLALGNGWHLMTKDFLASYDPQAGSLIGNTTNNTKINVPDVFIYVEKNIHETYKTMSTLSTIYERRVKERVELMDWMEKYIKANGKQEIYYEDENLIIYHIFQKDAQDAITESVLGS